MERNLLNLSKVIELLSKQYNSDFYVIWKCVKEKNQLINKGIITIFEDIVAITYNKEDNSYKVSYNFNNKFWNKNVYIDGHGVIFSPLFNEDDIIYINGEKYINEEIVKRWNVFTVAELGSLN